MTSKAKWPAEYNYGALKLSPPVEKRRVLFRSKRWLSSVSLCNDALNSPYAKLLMSNAAINYLW
eukprot:scaffold1620_cov124-Skeletonema_menzelii.AAC.10